MSSQSLEPSSITLRPVGPDDHNFLLEIYASTRAEELALVPWTREQRDIFVRSQFAAQQEHYVQKYPAASHDIILFEGRQVGRLYVARLDQEIRIVDITLLPRERNAGIGSHLIRQLLDEANRSGKVTRIYVEEFNPSLRLFDRLGFSPSEQHGIHLLLQWSGS
ncbi:MAG TPA: GNAT family N-acetyltransferase [Pyrinomonadaceae bacterium]|jgi:RimJ/RimL family protein N-acetyltransferase|nr:GNAT family N-acetyltransferase [Pyrinomonadaceae bacterium]